MKKIFYMLILCFLIASCDGQESYPQVYEYKTTYNGTYDELKGKNIVFKIILNQNHSFVMELDNVIVISPPMKIVNGKTVESEERIVIAKGKIKGSWKKDGANIVFNVDAEPWKNISSDFPFFKEKGQVKGRIEGKVITISSFDKKILKLKSL